MKLIGLTGPAGCGKDTLANHLVANHSYKNVKFADPIKDGLCAMFGWTREQLEDPAFKKTPQGPYDRTPRYLMQTLGTEWGRNLVAPDIWMTLTEAKIKQFLTFRNVAVSDVRFENEAALIRELGGTVYHVTRPGLALQKHASERGVAFILGDICISNDSDIGTLHAVLDQTLC